MPLGTHNPVPSITFLLELIESTSNSTWSYTLNTRVEKNKLIQENQRCTNKQ